MIEDGDRTDSGASLRYEVGPEALDAVYASAGPSLRISFPHAGLAVTVDRSDEVLVRPPDTADGPDGPASE
jgi:hypothetical protein